MAARTPAASAIAIGRVKLCIRTGLLAALYPSIPRLCFGALDHAAPDGGEAPVREKYGAG